MSEKFESGEHPGTMNYEDVDKYSSIHQDHIKDHV